MTNPAFNRVGNLLAASGIPAPTLPSELKPVSVPDVRCETCHDAGFVRYEVEYGDPRFGKSFSCPACTPPLEPIGVPADLQGKTFRDFDLARNPQMEPAYDRVLGIAKQRHDTWCAVLIGDPGLGKSLLAVAALQERWGYFWTWGALQRQIRKLCFSDDGPKVSEEDALQGWQEGQFLLVIDDIGAEKATEWSNGVLFSILNSRYQLKLPTILTTNNIDALEERVLDRYRVGAVVCKGKSQRPR